MNLKSCISLVILLSSFGSLWAQMGTIRGKVIDDETGETLIGVNIVLKGTTNGTSTDLDGQFNIKATEGTYTVVCSYISYATLNITDIVVKAGDVNNIGELRLKVNAIQTETVVITATQSRNNETAMATMQKKSANVMDAVSSQSFKKSGDSDVGAAVKRVTGVSVQGGKYVFVRGLGDRYTKTTLNGMEIPGLDPDRNSIQLDLFPTNLIDNISVFKTFTPDLAGDFTGAVVDIVTKDFPSEKKSSISASVGYNPDMNLKNNFLSYDSPGADLVASGANARDVPFDRNIELQPSAVITDAELVSGLTKKFDQTMGTQRMNSFLNTGFGYASGNQINYDSTKILFINAKKVTVGYNFAINYSRSFKFYDNVEYSEYITLPDTNVYQLQKARQDSGEVGIEEVFWSAFAGASIKKRNTSYGLNLMRLQNGTKQASLLEGAKSSFGSDQSAVLQKHILYYNQRSITNALFSIKHFIPEKDLEISFKSAPTLAQSSEPDFRQTVYNIEDEKIYLSGGGLPLVQRLFRDLEEWSLGNRLDVKWEREGKVKTTFKTGLAYTYKKRDFSILTYKFREISRRDDYTLDPTEILKPDNIFDSQTNPNGFAAQGFEQPNNNYESRSNNYAAYLMMESELRADLKAVYGARVENFTINYTGERQVVQSDDDVFEDEKILDETNFLPSVGLIYNFAEEANLRVNFSQTVARPSFKEKSAAEIIDALTGRIFIGNLDLEQTEISNYDIRVEKFFSGGQLMSLSGFYKQFTNPIEIVAFDQTATDQFTPRNSEEAIVYGLEFDAKRNLSFINEDLNKWSVGFNLTLVKSEIDRRKIITPGEDGVIGTEDDISEFDERVQNKRAGEKVDQFRTLQGQSPYVVNGYLNYTHDSLGFAFNVSYNVQGPRLALVGISNTPNVYEQPFHSLNFKVSKTFGENENSNLSLSVDNILNDDRESLFESFRSNDRTYTRYSPGRTISIGYGYSF